MIARQVGKRVILAVAKHMIADTPDVRLGSASLVVDLTPSAEAQTADVPLVVNLYRADNECRLTVDGKRMAPDAASLLIYDEKYSRGIMVSLFDKLYRCIGGSAYLLQQAGLSQADMAYWTVD